MLLFKVKSWELVINIIFAVVIGLLVGYGAIGFKLSIRSVEHLFFGTGNYTLNVLQNLSWYDRLIIPVVGALLVGPLIHFLAQEAQGHGVSEVMESIVVNEGKIHPKTVLTRSLASALTIGSGGSVGPEGPIVQIGAAIGSTLGQIFNVSPSRLRTFIGCGAAAGISATFNAPITGALFALEIIMKDFAFSRFCPILFSSIIGTLVSRSYWGNFPDFQLPAYTFIAYQDLILFSIVGILGGLVSVIYIKIIYYTENLFARLQITGALKPVIGGFGIGIIAQVFPHIYGTGHDIILRVASGGIVWQVLFLLIGAKLVATAMTIGSGGSGGIFTPSLFIGAVLGGALGSSVHTVIPAVATDPGAYVITGMGALVAGSTHAPLTAILLAVELSNNYSIIIPIMIACTLSFLISKKLHEESIYTLKLVRRGIDFFRQKRINVLKSLRVHEVMRKDFELILESTPLPLLLKHVTQSNQSNFFMVDSRQRLRGMISLVDLRLMLVERENLNHLVIASDIADFGVPVLTSDDTLDLAMEIFGSRNLDELPVVTNENKTKIIGRVLKNDVIAIYNKEVFENNILEGMEGRLAELDRIHHVTLDNDFIMTEINAPSHCYGKTITELAIRFCYGVEIILVKRKVLKQEATDDTVKSESMIRFIPDSNYQIQRGDFFLVIGDITDVEKFKQGISRYLL